MKYLKTIFAIFFILSLFSANTFCQNLESVKKLKQDSDFIFEGKIIKSTAKWNHLRTMIFTEHEVQINKIYKGNIDNSTQKIITTGGLTNGEFAFISHTLELKEGDRGLFFTKQKPFGCLSNSDIREGNHFANKEGSFIPKRFEDNYSTPIGYGAQYQKNKYNPRN